jgi:hypothetical protein
MAHLVSVITGKYNAKETLISRVGVEPVITVFERLKPLLGHSDWQNYSAQTKNNTDS